MNRKEIESTIRIIVSELLFVEEKLIKDSSNFINDLQADSLDAVEIVIKIEDKFGINIPDEDSDQIITFKSLVDMVENKIKK